MGFLGVLLILLYSLAVSAAICLYSLDIALLNAAGFAPFVAVLFLVVASFSFGEVVLHRIALRLTRYDKRNIVVTLPTSLLLQLLILVALVASRNSAFLGPVIRHKVAFALITLVAAVVANHISIRFFKAVGLEVATDRYAKLASVILIPLIILVPAAMYPWNSSPSDKSIVLITVDSWRYDSVSFITPEIITPNVEKLHQTGVTFDNYYAEAPYTWTSLSSIMTSLESPFHGVRVNGQTLNDKYLTLAEVLNAHGYRCFASTDLNLRQMGLDQGFSPLSLPRKLAIRALYTLNMLASRISPRQLGKYCFAPNSSMLTTMKALEFLRHHRSDKFFMWVHYYNEPHVPYIAPTYYTNMYNAGKSSWVDGSIDMMNALKGYPKLQDLVEGKTLGDGDLEYLQNLYRSELTTMDTELGMILENLRRSGLLGKTMIVLTADHGEDFGERGQFLHASNLYRTLLHVPLIMKIPEQVEKKRAKRLESAVDIAPTILQQAGIAPPSQFHGRSMLNSPAPGHKTQGDEWAFAETLEYGLEYPYNGYACSVTSRKYKYIFAGGHEELYDLEKDPQEKVNIAAANPDKVLEIREDLDDYFGLEDVTELIPVRKPEIGEKQLKTLRALGYIN